MSDATDNVAIVSSIYSAWARGEPAIGSFDPDVEWSLPHPGGQARGREQVLGFLRSYMGAWSEYRLELELMRTIDDDRVLALFTEVARGRSSGVETVVSPAAIWTLREGRVVRFEGMERAKALRELELES